MLKVFRENLKYLSWVLWLVIAVFILFVFVDFGATVPGGTAASDSAATVGNLTVSYREFERSYRQTEDFYRQTYGEQFNRELAQQIGLPIQVLDGLIADKLLLAEAKRIGLRVTDEEVARYISELPAFQLPDGGFIGEERYSQILRSNGFTVEQFEGSVRTQLLNTKVRSVLADSLFVTDEDVETTYRDRVETAKIRYLRLPSDRLREEITLVDEEIAAYFASHLEDFRIPEQRIADYLLIDPEKLRPTIEIDESELREYYSSNPDEFTRQEQVRARHILLQVDADRTAEAAEAELLELRRKIEAGEDFTALASQHSEDPGSKGKGGDLGFFGRGQMITEFEAAAFAAQAGEMVGPIQTSFGYHLIEVLERRPGGQRPYEEVEEEIRNRLLAERSRSVAETRATELATRVRKAKIDSTDTLRDMAQAETGVTVHTTLPFGREDSVPGIGRETSFSATAFELSVGETSEPVQVPGGWAILRLARVIEPRVPDLDEVSEQAQERLKDERQLDLALARLEEARQGLAADRTLDDVGLELSLPVDESGELRRLGPIPGLGTNPEITAAALALDEGGIGGPIVHDRDVVLFEVVARHRYDPADFERQKDRERESLREEQLNQILTSFIVKRRDEMGVRYDTDLLRNFELVPGES